MASKKTFKIGDWVMSKGNGGRIGSGGHRKGVVGVVSGPTGYNDGFYVVTMNKNGDNDRLWNYPYELKKIAAPRFVVAWSTEYLDPFCYANSLAEARRLNARKRVGGAKVIESRIFKAVK